MVSFGKENDQWEDGLHIWDSGTLYHICMEISSVRDNSYNIY